MVQCYFFTVFKFVFVTKITSNYFFLFLVANFVFWGKCPMHIYQLLFPLLLYSFNSRWNLPRTCGTHHNLLSWCSGLAFRRAWANCIRFSSSLTALHTVFSLLPLCLCLCNFPPAIFPNCPIFHLHCPTQMQFPFWNFVWFQ